MIQQINPKPPVIGGFIAGTLVHTKAGLVPIEKIQLSDYVLSKSDCGKGADEYKRVTNTFARDDAPIWLIEYGVDDMRIRHLVVTAEHPFWVEGLGWTPTTSLMGGYSLRCLGGSSKSEAVVLFVRPIQATNTENVRWAGGWHCSNGTAQLSDGPMVDLRNGEITVSQLSDYYFDDEAGGHWLQRVYNLEVEDSHTYYVGKMGLWVHTPAV